MAGGIFLKLSCGRSSFHLQGATYEWFVPLSPRRRVGFRPDRRRASQRAKRRRAIEVGAGLPAMGRPLESRFPARADQRGSLPRPEQFGDVYDEACAQSVFLAGLASR